MHFFPPALDIGDNDGFTSKDIFGRSSMGEGLTKLLCSSGDPIVMAVDGQWGSGKTVFLKMWAGQLRNAGIPVVYFDAFENDFVEDAYTAIASEIIALAIEKAGKNNSKTKKFTKKAKDVCKVVLRSSLKVGIKAITLNILDDKTFKDIEDDLADATSDLFDQHIGELLTNQSQQKETITCFKTALSELPALLSTKSKMDEDGQNAPKPLIFIIDELDRCQPPFALQLLERIKHFFDVPNVHFVLGTHLAQLQNSVSVVYGQNIDSTNYLEKFISFTFLLDDNNYCLSNEGLTTSKFIEHLLKSMKFSPEDQGDAEYAAEIISHVAKYQHLSLRTIERIFSVLAIAIAYSTQDMLRPPALLAILCVLKITNPETYKKAKRGTLAYSDVDKKFDLITHLPDDHIQRIQEINSNWWKYFTGEKTGEKFTQEVESLAAKYNMERNNVVPHIANNIIDRFTTSTPK